MPHLSKTQTEHQHIAATGGGESMNDNFYESKEFAIEEIAKGGFDYTPSEDSCVYYIETRTIRLNYIALSEWYDGRISCEQYEFDNSFKWQKYRDAKMVIRTDFKNKLRNKLGFDDWDYFIVSEVVGEVFAIVAAKAIKEVVDDAEE